MRQEIRDKIDAADAVIVDSKELAAEDVNEMTSAELKRQLDAARLKKEMFELKKLQREIEDMEMKDENVRQKRLMQKQTIEQAARDLLVRQSSCKHRKGGKDLSGLVRGDDTKYSVVRHQYGNGQWQILCTRCLKEWKPGDPDYVTAMEFPTDNADSSAVIFGFPMRG